MSTIKNITVEDLKAALEIAREVAAKTEDGGTCNFDAPVLLLPTTGKGCRTAKRVAKETIEAAGLDSFEWRKNALVIQIHCGGQGASRTRSAEAFERELRARGYETTMYYQMD